MTNADLLADATAVPADEQLSSLRQLVDRVKTLGVEIDQAQKELDQKFNEMADLIENKIPMKMHEIGIPSFTLEDGSEISVATAIYASITADNKQAAHEWLRENNLGDVIKNEIKASVPKGSDDVAAKIERGLTKLGVEFSRSESVHPGTLQALVREQLRAGVDVPRDLFSVHEVEAATIAVPKKRKRK